jgi:hypothetical protein
VLAKDIAHGPGLDGITYCCASPVALRIRQGRSHVVKVMDGDVFLPTSTNAVSEGSNPACW